MPRLWKPQDTPFGPDEGCIHQLRLFWKRERFKIYELTHAEAKHTNTNSTDFTCFIWGGERENEVNSREASATAKAVSGHQVRRRTSHPDQKSHLHGSPPCISWRWGRSSPLPEPSKGQSLILQDVTSRRLEPAPQLPPGPAETFVSLFLWGRSVPSQIWGTFRNEPIPALPAPTLLFLQTSAFCPSALHRARAQKYDSEI